MISIVEVSGILLETLLWTLLMLVPGYVFGLLGNLFGFRRLSVNWRIVASVPLSSATVPLLTYWSIRFGFERVLFTVIWLLAGLILVGLFRARRPFGNVPRGAIACSIIWIFVAVVSLADLRIGEGVYYSAVAFDHSLRVAVTDAVMRGGLPASTPLNHLNGPTPLRFHVFWFAVCSLFAKPGAIYLNSRTSLDASVIWAGFGVMCIIPLWLRLFEGLEGSPLRRRALIGISLLGVTGLDVLPGLVYPLITHRSVARDLEWWNSDMVGSWIDSALWVPHHLTAAAVALTGLLLIWYAATHCERKWETLAHTLVAGIAFACVIGLSAFVGVVTSVILVVWFGAALMRRLTRQALLLALAGAVTMSLAVPYLVTLPRILGEAKDLLAPGVWQSMFFTYQLQWLNGHLRIPDPIRPFISLPFTFAFEFGFFLFACVWKLKQLSKAHNLSERNFAALTLCGTAFFFCVFVRLGGIFDNPGMNWRGMLLVQFFLLIWATEFLDNWFTGKMRLDAKWTALAYALLAIGLASSVSQLVLLHTADLLFDRGLITPVVPENNIGGRTASLKVLYGQLDAQLPPNAIVQFNPIRQIDMPWGLYSHRQTAAAGASCSMVGGDEEVCESGVRQIQRIFDGWTKTPSEARAVARRFGIDVLVVADNDPIWRDRNAWIYQAAPAIQTPYARAYYVEP